MEPRCPYYIAPRYYVDPETDRDFEGSAMCDLVDKYCLVECGNECETYDEFLEEEEPEKTLGNVLISMADIPERIKEIGGENEGNSNK